VDVDRSPTPLAALVPSYRPIFDRDGLDAAVPAPEPPPGPNLDRRRSTVEEFFRVEAVVPVMLNQRRGYLAAVNGVQSLQLMLYNVFVECNQPQPPMRIKQWTAVTACGGTWPVDLDEGVQRFVETRAFPRPGGIRWSAMRPPAARRQIGGVCASLQSRAITHREAERAVSATPAVLA
jgi:hypothetical protein